MGPLVQQRPRPKEVKFKLPSSFVSLSLHVKDDPILETALYGAPFLLLQTNSTITRFAIFCWMYRTDDGSIMLNLGDHYRLLKDF